ncbi:hypothetical protein JT358_07125 [Micrococcales bacterium 31B]|nr:hypothetical protein [Micrococcales bacterium 31B]
MALATTGALAATSLTAPPAHAASATVTETHQIYKFSFSPRLYLVTTATAGEQTTRWLDMAAWAQTGYLPAQTVTRIPGVSVVKYDSSNELLLAGGGVAPLKLTFAQWASLGYPAPTAPGVGYYQTPGNAHVFESKVGQPPALLTFAQWLAVGAPTPQRDATVGSWLYKRADGAVYLRVAGRTLCENVWKRLTFAEWVDMGAPQPTATTSPWEYVCAENVGAQQPVVILNADGHGSEEGSNSGGPVTNPGASGEQSGASSNGPVTNPAAAR